MHLINDGVTVNGDTATVEFSSSGPATTFRCSLSLHVSLCKLHECNNNNDNYYTMNSGDTVADVNAIFQSTELGLICAAKYLDS